MQVSFVCPLHLLLGCYVHPGTPCTACIASQCLLPSVFSYSSIQGGMTAQQPAEKASTRNNL